MVQKELFGSFKSKDHGLCMRNFAWGQKSGKSAPFGAESGNLENPPEWEPCLLPCINKSLVNSFKANRKEK